MKLAQAEQKKGPCSYGPLKPIMHYPEYQRADLVLATGVIEGAY